MLNISPKVRSAGRRISLRPRPGFFFRVGLRKTLPLVAPKRLKLILPPYDLLIARANRAVKFSGGCLQNCGLVNLRRDRATPLSTVGNGTSAEQNAQPWLRCSPATQACSVFVVSLFSSNPLAAQRCSFASQAWLVNGHASPPSSLRGLPSP